MINIEGMAVKPQGTIDRDKPHILVVEDDPDLLKIAVAMLKIEDFSVIAAADGEEALEKLSSGLPIALLFTDIVLPGPLNGIEIAKEAKRLRPAIKVLLTSGFVRNAEIAGSDLGSDTLLLQKPYGLNELLDQIGAMLD